jgi:hypothetical protein
LKIPHCFKVLVILSVAGTIWCGDAFAQDENQILEDLKIFEEFGSIPDSLFLLDSGHSYPYEVLDKKATIQVLEMNRGITAVIDYLMRIKVHSDDPLEVTEASLVGLPFYFADGIERITNLEGITHHLNGGETRLDVDNIRTVDLNSRYKVLEFEMPDAGPGDIIEYKYTLERRYIEELPDFYFSHRVPTRNVELYFKNSDFIRYNAVPQNHDFEISYQEHRVDTSSVPFVFTYNRPNPVYVQTWKAENVPAVDASSFISSIDDIRAKIKFQISEFGLPRQPLENSWEFVAAQILRNDNPFTTIENAPAMIQAGRDMAEKMNSGTAVQDSIFHRINSNMQFNGQTAIFADGSLDGVLEGQPSSQAEINLVLLAMLKGAGIDAYPVYLSGRDFGRINMEFPSLFQFNSMLVLSEIEGEQYFMDASFPHSLPNLIPVKLYSERGMVLTDSTHYWQEISPDKSTFGFNIQMDAALQGDGSLAGTLTAETNGYPSQQIRQKLSNGEDVRSVTFDTFFDVYSDVSFQQISLQVDSMNLDKIQFEAEFLIEDYARTFSDGIEFRPMVVGYLFNNPFEATERRVPITLDAPEKLSINYTIELPEGFTTEVSGETRSTSLAGASLFEEYLAEDNRIDYSFDIDITRKEFPAEVYSQLRQIYERWVELSNETWFIDN